MISIRFTAALLAFLGLLVGASQPSFAKETTARESLWVGSDAAKARADVLLTAVRNASDHGLDPKW